LLEHVCAGVVLSLGVVEEEGELTVQTTFDLFTVFQEFAWLAGEVVEFFGGIDMLLQTLDWGDPGRFPDEGRYFSGVWLDCGEDLNAGRAENWSVELWSSRRNVRLPIAY